MNGLKTALLLGLMSALLILAGRALGAERAVSSASSSRSLMNVGSYWFSDKIVLRMYKAQAVGPDHPLYRMTARLAQKASLPMPKVYVIPDPSPNAFATGRNPAARGGGRDRRDHARPLGERARGRHRA